MRPDRPGYWWALVSGVKEIVKIIEVGAYLEVREFDTEDEWYLDAFEKNPLFGHWIGPAVPPKKLVKYEVFSDAPPGGCNYRFAMRVVKYDDVAEYDLIRYEDPSVPPKKLDVHEPFDTVNLLAEINDWLSVASQQTGAHADGYCFALESLKEWITKESKSDEN